MKKRLIIGDVHGRFNQVKKAYDLTNPDDVIILGDYVDTHEDITDEQQHNAFLDLLNLQDMHIKSGKGEFILLLGNHDFHYLYNDPKNERYSGFSYARLRWANPNFLCTTRDGIIQAIYIDEKNHTIYSHAGISNTWMKNNNLTFENINEHLKNNDLDIFCFTYGVGPNISRTGNCPENSCIWIRPVSLINDMYGDYTQVVGHTPVEKIFGLKNIIEEDSNLTTAKLILCDNINYQCVMETLDDNNVLINRTVVNIAPEDK